MKLHRCIPAALLLFIFVTGCKSTRLGTIPASEPLAMAEVEIPEAQLLDVGIQIFEPAELSSKGMERSVELGSSLEVQEAEAHFVPYHLKGTMQRTGNWGAVRVTPVKTDSVDIFVEGQILESSGEALSLVIRVSDTSGKQWYTKTYTGVSDEQAYTGNTRGELDAFQNVYNAISNDILAYKSSLNVNELTRLRTISKLKFAADLAPDAYGDHLAVSPDGQVQILRLPADGDPMLERLNKLREREYMLVDVMNEHYEDYYVEMWEPYNSWRELSKEEAENLRRVKSSALKRKVLGGAALAGAIALEVLSDGRNTSTLSTIGVIGGIEAIKSGIEIGREATFHREALTELGDSFAAEMSPRVVQVEGETAELSGTATEQYAQWRGLLRKIYAEETGFPIAGAAPTDGDGSISQPVPGPAVATSTLPAPGTAPPEYTVPPPTPDTIDMSVLESEAPASGPPPSAESPGGFEDDGYGTPSPSAPGPTADAPSGFGDGTYEPPAIPTPAAELPAPPAPPAEASTFEDAYYGRGSTPEPAAAPTAPVGAVPSTLPAPTAYPEIPIEPEYVPPEIPSDNGIQLSVPEGFAPASSPGLRLPR